MKEALGLIKNEGWSLYKVSKWYNITWITLKDWTKFLEDPARTSILKIGKPFVMPLDIEIRIVKYILSMQDFSFGLTVNQVRRVVFKVVEATGMNHLFTWRIKWLVGTGGTSWGNNTTCHWGHHQISICRVLTANRILLNDFYKKVENLLTKLDLETSQPIFGTEMELVSLMS